MVQNCTLLANSFGIHIDTSTNVTIAENDFSANMYGIILRNSHNSFMFNNSVIESNSHGITFYDSNYNFIDNCTIINSGVGISIQNSHENTIRSNLIANTTVGISVYYLQERPMDRNQNISNNTFIDNAEDIKYNEKIIEPTEDDRPITDFSVMYLFMGMGGFFLFLYLIAGVNTRQMRKT